VLGTREEQYAGDRHISKQASYFLSINIMVRTESCTESSKTVAQEKELMQIPEEILSLTPLVQHSISGNSAARAAAKLT
jgi:hypothetical protein